MSAASSLPPNDDRGGAYLGVIIGFMVPSLMIIAGRTLVRIYYTKLWWDDYLMLAAVPCLIANNGLSIASIHDGIGRHQIDIPVEKAMMAAKWNTIAQPLNIWALFFVKASIVTFLFRMKPAKIHIYTLWATLGLLLSITIAIFVITMAQCQPLAKEWNPTIKGNCWPGAAFQDAAYILSGCTILTDVVYIGIPVVFLWNVQLKKAIKYSIWGVLSFGLLSMGCSIAAIPFYHALASTKDVTYEIVTLASIKTAELNIAILTACAPPLQPLFQRLGKLIWPASKPKSWESRQVANRRLDYDTKSHQGREGNSYTALEDLAAPMGHTNIPFTERSNERTTTVAGNHNAADGVTDARGLQPPFQTIRKTTDFNLDYSR